MGQIAWEQQWQINGCFIRLAELKQVLFKGQMNQISTFFMLGQF